MKIKYFSSKVEKEKDRNYKFNFLLVLKEVLT